MSGLLANGEILMSGRLRSMWVTSFERAREPDHPVSAIGENFRIGRFVGRRLPTVTASVVSRVAYASRHAGESFTIGACGSLDHLPRRVDGE